jgi:hypothetical protein
MLVPVCMWSWTWLSIALCVQMQRENADKTLMLIREICNELKKKKSNMIVCETFLTWLLAVVTLILFIIFFCEAFLSTVSIAVALTESRSISAVLVQSKILRTGTDDRWRKARNFVNVRQSCWGGHVGDQHHKLQPSSVLGSVLWRFVHAVCHTA